MRGGDPYRGQRLVDHFPPLVVPADEPLKQRAERDEFRALGDQRNVPDPDLRARHHGERGHADAVEEHAVRAPEILEKPSVVAVRQHGVGP